jgi:adenylosuccinate synthase
MQCVDLVMGAQWGSEGKGMFATYIGKANKYNWLVSAATRNAGHTAYTEDGVKLVSRYLPCSAITNPAPIFLAAGTNIHRDTLEAEIEQFEAAGIQIRKRLYISDCAGLLTHSHEEQERERRMDVSIGSTCEGVGEALVDRIRRQSKTFHEKYDEYRSMSDLHLNGLILLECSQGYLLSNLSGMYPYTTSRICSASAFLSYAKLPPRSVRDVYGVFRTWPIRVANRTKKPLDSGGWGGGWDPTDSSGPMHGNEVAWEEVRKYCGATSEQLPIEITTVTKLPRRIARMDPNDTTYALQENGITQVCLSFLNYIDWSCYGIAHFYDLPAKVKDWVIEFEMQHRIGVALLSTSPTVVFARDD